MITAEAIYSALLFTSMFLAVMSMPQVLMALRVTRSRMDELRKLRDGDSPEEEGQMDEWLSINTPMGYSTALMTEIERLNGIRPLIFQAEISGLILVFLVLISGVEEGLLIWIVLLIVILMGSGLLAGYWMGRYIEKYQSLVQSCMEHKEEEENLDIIYG